MAVNGNLFQGDYWGQSFASNSFEENVVEISDDHESNKIFNDSHDVSGDDEDDEIDALKNKDLKDLHETDWESIAVELPRMVLRILHHVKALFKLVFEVHM